jgi:hypothetical protein
MALYQRGRIWYADYYASGERLQESTVTANKREAGEVFGLAHSPKCEGRFVKPVNTTLPELGKRYIEHAKLRKRSWKRNVQLLGNLHAFFGPAKRRDITPLRVEEYQRKRAGKYPRRHPTGKWPCSSTCSTWRSDGDNIRARIPCGW